MYAKTKIALICAKFGVDLINTCEVTSRKTNGSDFFIHRVHFFQLKQSDSFRND